MASRDVFIMWGSFLAAFTTAFPLVFCSEFHPDTVLCEGGALAASYPLRPVLMGISGAFLTKMLLVAFLGHLFEQWLPMPLKSLPRYIAAVTFLFIAWRVCRRPAARPADGAARSGDTPAAPADTAVTGRWRHVPRNGPAWQIAGLTFAVLFFSEWMDSSHQVVMQIAAGALGTPGSPPVHAAGNIAMGTSLGAALGGASALTGREVLAIVAGARLRPLVLRPWIRGLFAGCCVAAAVVTVFRH